MDRTVGTMSRIVLQTILFHSGRRQETREMWNYAGYELFGQSVVVVVGGCPSTAQERTLLVKSRPTTCKLAPARCRQSSPGAQFTHSRPIGGPSSTIPQEDLSKERPLCRDGSQLADAAFTMVASHVKWTFLPKFGCLGFGRFFVRGYWWDMMEALCSS